MITDVYLCPSPTRLYHVLTALILRPHYGYQNLSTLIMFLLRPYNELSDCNTILPRFYCDYRMFLPRFYYMYVHEYRSYIILSNNVNIVFHINTVQLLLFMIKRIFLGNNTVMPPKSTKTRGNGGRG